MLVITTGLLWRVRGVPCRKVPGAVGDGESRHPQSEDTAPPPPPTPGRQGQPPRLARPRLARRSQVAVGSITSRFDFPRPVERGGGGRGNGSLANGMG